MSEEERFFEKYYEENSIRWHCAHMNAEEIAFDCFLEGFHFGRGSVQD